MGSKILCIIPARSGSKGIKNKNIIQVGGHPLISLSIKEACELKKHSLVADVIVSTDSNKIAKIALKYGASVPFIRPRKISGDTAKSVDLIIHALNFFQNKGKVYDAVLLMQPT